MRVTLTMDQGDPLKCRKSVSAEDCVYRRLSQSELHDHSGRNTDGFTGPISALAHRASPAAQSLLFPAALTLAQRAFAMAASLARPAALIVRFRLAGAL